MPGGRRTARSRRSRRSRKPAIGSAKIRYTPLWLLMLLGRMCDVLAGVLKRSLPLSKYRVLSLKPLSPADISTARSVLGWSPAIGSGRGLELTFGRFRASRAEQLIRNADST